MEIMVFLILLTLVFGSGLIISLIQLSFFCLIFYIVYQIAKGIIVAIFEMFSDLFKNGIFIKSKPEDPLDEKLKWMNRNKKEYRL